MIFQNPVILWALFALSIPLIIHLFNFRRVRKVYFPHVSFLKEISERNRRQSQLRHLLVLLARLLAVAALVLAFAGPRFADNDSEADLAGDRVVGIYIDNSFSMQGGDEFEGFLTRAVKQVRNFSSSMSPATRYQLLTNDLEPSSSLLLSRDDLIRNIEQLEISPEVRPAASMLRRLYGQMPEKQKKDAAYLLVSDFQTLGELPAKEQFTDSTGQYLFVPVNNGAELPNLYIDTAYLMEPVRQAGTGNHVVARIVNQTGQDLEKLSVRFSVNGSQKNLAAIDMPDGEARDIELPFMLSERGAIHAMLQVDDYPVSFDDTWYLSWFARGVVDILHIHDKDNLRDFVPRLFAGDTLFRVDSKPYGQVDYNQIPDYTMIILDGVPGLSAGLALQLDQALGLGASVLVFPSALPGARDELNQWLRQYDCAYHDADTVYSGVSWINLEHSLLQDVYERNPGRIDMPVVHRSFPYSRPGISEVADILRYQVERPFLSSLGVQGGDLFLCAVPLDEAYSNYPIHSMFVYLTIDMAVRAGGYPDVSYTMGTEEPVGIGKIDIAPDQVLSLRDPESGTVHIPEMLTREGKSYIRLHNALGQAGNYDLVNGVETVGALAFNYDRRESELQFPSLEELREWITAADGLNRAFILDGDDLEIRSSIEEVTSDRSLTFWFILLALIMLLTEAVLIRFMR